VIYELVASVRAGRMRATETNAGNPFLYTVNSYNRRSGVVLCLFALLSLVSDRFPSATGRKFLVGRRQRLNGICNPPADLWSAS
jgi:hypothetical protein